ncbi:hypothetical protein B5J94_04325, partial [Moraxella lacunata]
FGGRFNLNLPNYQVVPSQKAIAEAIEARRASRERAVTARQSASRSSTARQTRNDTPRRGSQVTAKPAQKALPRAQMTLVTPTQQGSATGTNSKPTSNTTAGGGNLAGTLKNTRQQTANNAKRVNSLNEELSSAARKVQLQNQRLAELENRLKNLKEKQ